MSQIPRDEEAIFHTARQIEDREERRAYLDQACGEDRDLRERVDSLLRSHEEHPNFLESLDPVAPGQCLFKTYEILRKLGEGGMGSVWLVNHVVLNDERALKLIVPGISFDPQIRARFEREARVMARLKHPNAVVVHDARVGSGAAFIAMEFIRGRSLNNILRRGEPMPPDWIGRVLDQLCAALQVAHEQGVVHRDLKPSNLMLLDGRPPGQELLKVLDFGIAKILESDNKESDCQPLTEAEQFLGTLQYASPEQLTGGDVDGRSDLYSTGVILYEMLTGFRPFVGNMLQLIKAHEHEPPRMAAKNPQANIPPGVERVVLRCLAKDPNARPQTPGELADEFRRALQEAVIGPPPPPENGSHRPRRWRIAGIVTAAVAAAVLSLLGCVIDRIKPQWAYPPPVVLEADPYPYSDWANYFGLSAPVEPQSVAEQIFRADSIRMTLEVPPGDEHRLNEFGLAWRGKDLRTILIAMVTRKDHHWESPALDAGAVKALDARTIQVTIPGELFRKAVGPVAEEGHLHAITGLVAGVIRSRAQGDFEQIKLSNEAFVTLRSMKASAVVANHSFTQKAVIAAVMFLLLGGAIDLVRTWRTSPAPVVSKPAIDTFNTKSYQYN